MGDSAWAVVAAAFVGAASVPVADLLRELRPSWVDYKRRRLLRAMLEDERFQWRKLATLSNVIGTDPEMTKRLLIEIDARASESGDEVWGLIARNPLPASQ